MSRNCLILDDSRMVRAIASSLMTALDFDVAEAATGREALLRIAQTMPDLLLVDWNMPEMDGITFIRALRGAQNGKRPRVLLMSTETRLSEIRIALRAGADSYLMKPFNRDQLVHRVKRFGLL
jgi:two-component system, chemotaxis family, chemotaxis protein CheY